MAGEAFYATGIHDAPDEIVPLHAILVSRGIGEMSETGFAQAMLFETPEIMQAQPDVEADGPVVLSALDRVGDRASL